MVKNYNYNYNIKEPVVIPYNNKNKLIKDTNVKKILKSLNINVDITDIEIYRKSLTHKSYIKKEYYTNHKNDLENAKNKMSENILDLREQSNERLEFLGDTIIKAVVSHYLFERYPNEDEGFMTRLKTKIENQKSLARFARKIGIDEFIIISVQNEFGNIGRTNDKILEDAFESFLGALYLDCGFLVCKRFMRYILENYIDYSDLLYNDDNFKDQLLRVYHSFKWEHPKYVVISQEGPPHKRVFTIGVYDNENRIVGKATDTSKKRAEQKASKMALYYYKKLNHDQLNDNIYKLI